MSYESLSGFLYDLGDGVGEFLPEEQKVELRRLSLEEIVRGYIDRRSILSAFLLKRQIKTYIKVNMAVDGLEYVDPPFNQDTSFPEDYFEGDLHVFLNSVLNLLDSEIKTRRCTFLLRLIGKS